MLKLVYNFFTGLLLVLFIGFGISAFYEEPKYPEPPTILKFCGQDNKNANLAKEINNELKKQDKREKQFQIEINLYNRNVSVMVLIGAIIYLIISLNLSKKLLIISDGLLLGGVFSLIYSIGRGFAANDSKFQFVVIAIGLIIALFLGYIKFIKPQENKSAKK